MEKYQEVERSIIKKFRPKIYRKFNKGVIDYQMIQEGDKIAVCMSGGKDSMLLAKCMQELCAHGRVHFSCVYLVMDPGYSEKHLNELKANAKLLNIPIEIFKSNIFEVVTDVEDSPCYLCARMRRGCLYKAAKERGCNKIALGHHFDDVVETILLSILYGGEFKTMMPKLHSAHFPGMELIRPLYLVKEQDIIAWGKYNGLSFLKCACKFTEEIDPLKEDKSKRREVKALIKKLKEIYPNIDNNIFASACNVNLGTLIGYHKGDKFTSFLDEYDDEKKETIE